MILSVQLITTAIPVIYSCNNPSYKKFIIENIWLLYLSVFVNLISCLTLIYVRELSRKVPINFILLAIFTISESYLVSCTTARYDPQSILIATILTASIVVGLTIYAWRSTTDFTIFGGLLYTAMIALIIASTVSYTHLTLPTTPYV